MSHNSPPLPRGWPRPHYLSIVQHNSLGSWDVFLSLFNSFASAKSPPDIVCLQDPPFWRSRLSSFQNYTSFAPPGGTGNKPKVAFYVSTYLLAQATVLPVFFARPNVAALDVYAVDLFGKSFSHVHILNLYNLWTKRPSQMTVSPLVAFPEPSCPTLVVEGFNSHHPLPDPLHSHSAEELATSFPYFSRPSELGFGFLNNPHVCTCFPLGGSGRLSVLDISFISLSLLLFSQTWDTPSPPLAQTMFPSKLYFHIHLLPPLLPPPIGP